MCSSLRGCFGMGFPCHTPQPAGGYSNAKQSPRSCIERSSQDCLQPVLVAWWFGQFANMTLAADGVTISISNPVCCDPPASAPPAGIRMQR